MTIEAENLCFSFESKPVLNSINLKIKEGESVAFLGPNGVGKTTLFRALLGFLMPQKGSLKVDGKPIESYSRKDLAKCIAYIPQSYNPAFNHTVLDCVLMGFSNRLGVFESPSKEHEEKALSVLAELGINDLAGKSCMNISGGERQLMLIARALVQDARILIMDEPTASLDYGNSYRVMEKVKNLAMQGYSVLFSTHDPNQALTFSSRIIAMKDGKILSDTTPDKLSSEILSRIYSINIRLCPECNSIVID